MPKTPKTDQERIAELERRVETLETKVLAELDKLANIWADTAGMDLGEAFADELEKAAREVEEENSGVEILGDLGLPPFEKRAGRGRNR